MTPAFRARLPATRDWVFDLDNTIYPATSTFFAEIGRRMTDYVSQTLKVDAAEAFRLQKLYYLRHGATLAGLVAEHGIDPHDFVHFVHDVDPAPHLDPDPELASLIARLPGRKLVFTNGGRAHAERVVRHLGLEALFDAHFAIEDADFIPKPQPKAFARFIDRHAVDAAGALMIEDSARNLEPAHALGFATVLLAENGANAAAPHVHHVADDLKRFLRAALGAL